MHDGEEAANRLHIPKVAFVAKSSDYASSSGKNIGRGDVDVLMRALSMSQLDHALIGTAAVATVMASAVRRTLVNLAAGGGDRTHVTFGYCSGPADLCQNRNGSPKTAVDNAWTILSSYGGASGPSRSGRGRTGLGYPARALWRWAAPGW